MPTYKFKIKYFVDLLMSLFSMRKIVTSHLIFYEKRGIYNSL